VVSGDLLFQTKQFGGADALGALQELIDKAQASGVSLADLAKGSATDAEILRSVFGKASEGNQQGVHGFSGETFGNSECDGRQLGQVNQ
jgi:hypothetical protein